jgi:SAM-dependent methyltransferase
MSDADGATRERQKEAQRRQWDENAASLGAMGARGGGLLPAATALLLAALPARPGLRALDVASGAGDPALAIAAAIAADGGHVTATDLVPAMLRQGEALAATRGLANVTFQEADAEALPFPDAAFDAVTCRFGVMLVPDAPLALAEMRRVLAPGGRVLLLVWGPRERDALSQPLLAARRFLGLPEPVAPAGAPDRFRFSAPGELAALVRAAGFARVTEAPHDLPASWPGGEDRVFATLLQMDGAVREAAAALSAARRDELGRRVREAQEAEDRRPGGPTSAVILVTGER